MPLDINNHNTAFMTVDQILKVMTLLSGTEIAFTIFLFLSVFSFFCLCLSLSYRACCQIFRANKQLVRIECFPADACVFCKWPDVCVSVSLSLGSLLLSFHSCQCHPQLRGLITTRSWLLLESKWLPTSRFETRLILHQSKHFELFKWRFLSCRCLETGLLAL